MGGAPGVGRRLGALRGRIRVDRAYVLAAGRVVFEGTPQSVQETNVLTEVFLGKIGAPTEQ